jgi:hypothetical protein
LANVTIAGHRETLAVESEEMGHYLKQRAWEAGKELFGQAKAKLADCIERLKAQALYDGLQHPVFPRVGEHRDAIYIDMGDTEAIRIGRFGWEVVKDPPVYFRRLAGMLPLPFLEPGGSIDELRPFCNIDKSNFVLVVAWLPAALRSRGVANAAELAKALKQFGYPSESGRALSQRPRRIAEPLRTGFGIVADFSKRSNATRLIKLTSSPSSFASRPGKVR